MNVGLLWHDSSSKDLAHKVAQAAHRYQIRFGHPPNVCYVHPAQLPADNHPRGTIIIRASHRVLRHHLWLGQETADGA